MLHQSPTAEAARCLAGSGRVTELLLRAYEHTPGSSTAETAIDDDEEDRYVVPAFATVCSKQAGAYRPARDPYVELLWVSPEVRRLGVGTLMVREIAFELPAVKQVRSCLPEALPFWHAVSEYVSQPARSKCITTFAMDSKDERCAGG